MTIASNSISKIIAVIVTLLVGLYIITNALLSNTSILGQLYLYVAIAAFLLGLFLPRNAIFALMVCTAYIDFFKRLMVIAGTPTHFDVACSLATPPLLCAGAVINLVLSVIMGKIRLNKGNQWSFFFACALVVAAYFTSSAEGARGFGGLVNLVAYPFLIVLIPIYFSATEDKVKLMKLIYVLFIGVALYMIKHALYGLADFEYAYLLTNLSVEKRILVEGENMRCFSTMNGAGIVSVMCALMFFWSFANVWKNGMLSVLGRCMLACLFATACYFTLSRTGWFCGVVALIAYVIFLNWKTTVLAYVVGISLVVSLVVFSPAIRDAKVLESLEVEVKQMIDVNDSRARQASSLGSMNGRLNGWVNLMTKENMWTPFGWRAAGFRFDQFSLIELGDDMIFWFIVGYGYVPTFLGAAVLLTFLYKLHKFVCSLPRDSKDRKIATICLATSIGILIGGLSNAAQLAVFPLNLYFYLCISIVYSTYLNQKEKIKAEKVYKEEYFPINRASLVQ